MKFAALFFEACAVLGLLAVLRHVRVPLCVWAFLAVQFVYATGALIGLQTKTTSSSGYAVFYVAALLASTACAVLTAGWLVRGLAGPLVGFVGVGALTLGGALSSVAYSRLLEIYAKYGKEVPWQSLLALNQFSALLFLAALTVAAWLFGAQTEVERTLTFGLGGFWLALAGFTLAATREAVRGPEQWNAWRGREAWIPALIGLVAVAWMAYRLTGQAELSRAATTEMHVAVAEDTQAAAAEFDLWRNQ